MCAQSLGVFYFLRLRVLFELTIPAKLIYLRRPPLVVGRLAHMACVKVYVWWRIRQRRGQMLCIYVYIGGYAQRERILNTQQLQFGWLFGLCGESMAMWRNDAVCLNSVNTQTLACESVRRARARAFRAEIVLCCGAVVLCSVAWHAADWQTQ